MLGSCQRSMILLSRWASEVQIRSVWRSEGAELVYLETKSGSSGIYNYCKIEHKDNSQILTGIGRQHNTGATATSRGGKVQTGHLRKQHEHTLQKRLSNLCPQRISRQGLTKSRLTRLVFAIIPLQAGGQTQNLQTSLPTSTSVNRMALLYGVLCSSSVLIPLFTNRFCQVFRWWNANYSRETKPKPCQSLLLTLLTQPHLLHNFLSSSLRKAFLNFLLFLTLSLFQFIAMRATNCKEMPATELDPLLQVNSFLY